MIHVVNLQHIGAVPHHIVTRAQLQAVLECAEEIYQDTSWEELGDLLDAWELALCWRSFDQRPVDDAWYSQAVLTTCLRGLRGDARPKIYSINQDF